jgi:chemotaxis protein MotB
MRATPRTSIPAVLIAAISLSGCAWQSDLDALQAQNAQLRQQLAQEQARVARLQGAIKYTVESDLLFAPGSWSIRERGKQIMGDLAAKLASTQENRLVVTGYTDNAPIGPALRDRGVTSNEELSQKRAESVVQFLVARGVKPDLLTAQGRGEADPVAPNDTPQGRAKNRRVEISVAS